MFVVWCTHVYAGGVPALFCIEMGVFRGFWANCVIIMLRLVTTLTRNVRSRRNVSLPGGWAAGPPGMHHASPRRARPSWNSVAESQRSVRGLHIPCLQAATPPWCPKGARPRVLGAAVHVLRGAGGQNHFVCGGIKCTPLFLRRGKVVMSG